MSGLLQTSEPAPRPCPGHSVLIVEDEALIAFGLEEALEDEGFSVAGPFATCSEALDSVQNAPPAVAVLDALLRDGPCLELARELRQREIPFLIYSGRDAFDQQPPELDGILWIEKPAPVERVVAALVGLLQGSTGPTV